MTKLERSEATSSRGQRPPDFTTVFRMTSQGAVIVNNVNPFWLVNGSLTTTAF
jgi:hypothetical protein